MSTPSLDSCVAFQFPNTAFDIIGVASSAGGLAALTQVLQRLPASFPAAIAIVQHLSPNTPSLLAQILSWSCALKVKQAEDGEQLQAGTVYVAPPDHHLLVQADGRLTLAQTAPVNFARPAADPLFESIARSFHRRAIAIVLTGMGQDGAQGIRAIKQAGGMTMAQSAATAQFSSMPLAAIRTHAVDLVLPLEQIPLRLMELVMGKKVDGNQRNE